jgi:CHAT domain-containing protein/tetratricopeptide (TPR) repeat protein
MQTKPLLSRSAFHLLALGAILLSLAWPGMPAAEQPRPQPLTDKQKARLKERDRLFAEAKKLAQAGKLAETIGALEKVLAIEREVFGAVHEKVALTLETLAQVQEAREDFAAGGKARAEVLALREKLWGPGHWRVTDARIGLAYTRRLASLDKSQRLLLARGKGLAQKAFDLHRQGKAKAAIPMAQEVVKIRKALLDENHPSYADSLNNLAVLYKAMGDYRQALPLYLQARDLRKKLLTENHPDYAASLNNLASLYKAMGDYRQALPLFEQARDLLKKLPTENHPHYATSLNNLARLYQAMGDYPKALPLYEQARDLRKKLLTENHPHYADSLSNLASLYKAMGDYRQALPLYEQARDLLKKLLTENHPAYAASLNNLALLYQAMGDFRQALPLLLQARDLRKKLLTENHPDYAASLLNLARLYQAMGDYRKALPLYVQARDLTKKLLTENHRDYAVSLHNLAFLYQDMGAYRQALPLFEQARDLYKKLLTENHPLYAQSLNHLAALLYHLDKFRDAAALSLEALEIEKTHLDSTFAALSERQRLDFLTKQKGSLSFLLSLQPRAKTTAATLYLHVLAWKGALAARQAEEQLARDQPRLQPVVEELRQVRAGLARLAGATPATAAQRQDWRKRFDALEKDKEKLEVRLAQESAAYRRFRALRRANAQQVIDVLPPQTVFIDLLFYTHNSMPPEKKGPLRGERRLAAFVLAKGQEPVMVDLKQAEPIARAVARWREAAVTNQVPDRPGQELARLVWQPLRRHLGGAQTILIAPDGDLCGLPFAALPGSKPGTYLVEELAIGYVTSGRHLLELEASKGEKRGAGLFTLSGLDYGKPAKKRPASDAFAALAYEELPGTQMEADSIARLYRKTFPRAAAARRLGGKSAGAGRFKQELPPLSQQSPRYLHLATHAFFEKPAPAPRGQSAAFDLGRAERVYRRNPLLSSGLVLSGANESYERGILTAEEVSQLDLRGVELATLSACQTALGVEAAGEGLLGLQRAFQMAGARSLAASLWSVDDAATAVLMEEFYNNLWTKKLPKLEALRQAQLTLLRNPELREKRRQVLLALLKKRGVGEAELISRGILPKAGTGTKPVTGDKDKRSHPRYWAAFVLSGEWR